MKGINFKSLCILFLFLLCLVLNSCKTPENILQSSSEVDFSTPQKVQISFNERIYDTTITKNGSLLEIVFVNEKDLLNGACIRVSNGNYKFSYNELVFEGDMGNLYAASLPAVIYAFFTSFENTVILDSFDNERKCRYIKRNINDYFVVLEAYEKENKETIYSIEIK